MLDRSAEREDRWNEGERAKEEEEEDDEEGKGGEGIEDKMRGIVRKTAPRGPPDRCWPRIGRKTDQRYNGTARPRGNGNGMPEGERNVLSIQLSTA